MTMFRQIMCNDLKEGFSSFRIRSGHHSQHHIQRYISEKQKYPCTCGILKGGACGTILIQMHRVHLTHDFCILPLFA